MKLIAHFQLVATSRMLEAMSAYSLRPRRGGQSHGQL